MTAPSIPTRTAPARRWPLALMGAALLAAAAGCSQLPRQSDADAAPTGVTVYGAVDVGAGRVGR